MNLKMLTELAEKGEIRELELLSLEGGFYIARVRLDHVEMTLVDDDAKPMRIALDHALARPVAAGSSVPVCAGAAQRAR